MWVFSCEPWILLASITFCLFLYMLYVFYKEIKEFFVKLF